MRCFLTIKLLITFGILQSVSYGAPRPSEVAFEKTAMQLELVRNQIDLTIENHASTNQDLSRQEREFEIAGVFLRVPLTSHDVKQEKDLLESLKSDWNALASTSRGTADEFTVKKIHLAGDWKQEPKQIPSAVPFDKGYEIPENQLTDHRPVKVELTFKNKVPENLVTWFKEKQSRLRRLQVLSKAAPKNKAVQAQLNIFRFREIEYPKFVAPDLSHYRVPGNPQTPIEKSAAARVEKYRTDIVRLWPKAEPYLKDVGTFALNDQRMNFFMKHVNLKGH